MTAIPRPEPLGEATLLRDIRAVGLPEPIREYRFHPVHQWRFDFAWPIAFVAAEVEGGTWSSGAHSRGRGFAEDCEKYNQATLMGWRVFRFTTEMATDGPAIDVLRLALT